MSDDISEVEEVPEEGDAMAFTDLESGVRRWAFLPGDRVLCLVPLSEAKGDATDELVAGTVQRIMIPGPMRPHKVVQVELDEDTPIKLAWWDPDRIEHFQG